MARFGGMRSLLDYRAAELVMRYAVPRPLLSSGAYSLTASLVGWKASKVSGPVVFAHISTKIFSFRGLGSVVPIDTSTYDIPEHFCLILKRVVLVPERIVDRFGHLDSRLIDSFRNKAAL